MGGLSTKFGDYSPFCINSELGGEIMKFNAVKNTYEYPKEQAIKGFRVDNETEHEVVLDVVLCRGVVVVTVKKVFTD